MNELFHFALIDDFNLKNNQPFILPFKSYSKMKHYYEKHKDDVKISLYSAIRIEVIWVGLHNNFYDHRTRHLLKCYRFLKKDSKNKVCDETAKDL